jgi:hypothetical protein
MFLSQIGNWFKLASLQLRLSRKHCLMKKYLLLVFAALGLMAFTSSPAKADVVYYGPQGYVSYGNGDYDRWRYHELRERERREREWREHEWKRHEWLEHRWHRWHHDDDED